MAVFALNNAHAAFEPALSVEPVRLADAGIQVGVGEDLQLTAQGDVNDLIHRVVLGCFPNAPVTRCISEKFRVAVRPMLGAAVSPPGRRHTFRVRCYSPAGLHGLASSHMGSPAGSRACMEIEVCVSRYARFRGSIREDSIL
jgi:hypothetical protein